MASRHLILIAGMHRSGTSILTRALNLAGVPLPTNLKPASPGVNDDGFWEPIEVKQFHDEVLKRINSRWDDPREIPEPWFASPPFESFRAWLTDWIAREFKDYGMLAVKDPRTCRLIPLWRNACAPLGIDVHAVIIARNPIEVARSLKTRDRFPETLSFFLWLRHFLDAERFTRGRSRSFVTFEGLMADRLGTVRRIARELGLSFPVADEELTALLDEAVKPQLRHHVASDDDVARAAATLPALTAVWEWAQQAGAGAMPDPAPLDEVVTRMRQSEQAQAQAAQAQAAQQQ